MQILKYESKQYAGVRNQNVAFTKGMNVVLGDNETGKSTMISGIYETLLRPSKINLKTKAGMSFSEQSFPTGGGNSIDGIVQLAIGEDKYIIEKKWNQNKTDSSTTFIDDSLDRIYTGLEAEEKINKLLNYGEAIYNHIVFGRQNNEAAILDWFYSFIDTEKIQGEGIVEARKKISEALSAAGGISEDLYLQKLKERIKALEDHWNFSLNAPEKGRGINNRWDKKVSGEILKAYYDWEEQKETLKNEKDLMKSIADDENVLQEKRNRKSAIERQLQKLNQSKSAVEMKALQFNSKKACTQNLGRFRGVEQKWPELKADKESIEMLSIEKEEQEKRNRKQELEKNVEELHGLEKQRKKVQTDMVGMEKIVEDNGTCQQLMDQIDGIQLKLGSAKLHAQITMLSDHVAQMATGDGEIIQIDKQYDAPVNGFVKIQIPGIAEIMVAPQELDVAGLQKQIEEKQDEIQKIFDKYQVGDKDALDQKCGTYQDNKSNLSDLDSKIRTLLNGKSIEELERELDSIQTDETVVVRENLLDDVQDVLSKYGAKAMDSCRAVVQVQINAYEKEYQSEVRLKEMIAEEEQKLDTVEEALRNCR